MRQNITLDKYKEIFKEYEMPKEIIELFLFQFGKNNDSFIYPFYMDFVLDNEFTWFCEDSDKEKELLNSVIAFASSDGSGGYFAFWLQEENKDLSNTPIIHISSEGGSHLVCKNIYDLLIIMTGDLDHTTVDPDSDPSDYSNDYKNWAKETFNIDAIDVQNTEDYETPSEVEKIIENVNNMYEDKYITWKAKFFHDY